MPENMSTILGNLKNLIFDTAMVTFYVVSRKLVNRDAVYTVKLVNTEDSLRKKLRNKVVNAISHSNSVKEYDYITADLDEEVLGVETSSTDLEEIISTIYSTNVPFIANYNDLIEAFFYVIRIDAGNQVLYAVRRTSESWTAKKIRQMANVTFRNNVLIDIDNNRVFQIDGKVDFISYCDMIFILDKKNFETVLNFREGMERNRDEFVRLIRPLNYFVNPDEFTDLVGNNSTRLKKLAQVKKAGYYNDPDFMRNMVELARRKNWDVPISSDNKITVSKENVDLILRLLNNDRLESLINHEEFDVDVKKRI